MTDFQDVGNGGDPVLAVWTAQVGFRDQQEYDLSGGRCTLIYTLIHSYTQSHIYPYTYTLIHSYTHTLKQSGTHTFIHTLNHTSLYITLFLVYT